jgi:hypothetical protein
MLHIWIKISIDWFQNSENMFQKSATKFGVPHANETFLIETQIHINPEITAW